MAALLNIAFQALRRGARFLATNADATCPVPGGELADAGAVIGALEGCTKRKVELVVGKPSSLVVAVVLERLGRRACECLMVGDSLEVDIVIYCSVSEYPRATWRLLRSPPADGAINMAVDEAILRTVTAGRVPPTLRFYAWEPACLSLGRAQPLADVDLQAFQATGFDLVRRPTGGKAILHVDELTYSVVAPEGEPRVAASIVESYRRLSAGLVRGLERLGIRGLVADRRATPPLPPQDWGGPRGGGGGGGGKSPVCFEVPSDYEITASGRKLVGSAQMRAQSVVLQHGALPLYGDITRICPLLTARPDPARVRARATTVEETLGRPVTWDEVADALAAGFAEALNLHLEPGTLTEEERIWADKLRAEKYAAEEWTGRV